MVLKRELRDCRERSESMGRRAYGSAGWRQRRTHGHFIEGTSDGRVV
jgi:hypothetical protein